MAVGAPYRVLRVEFLSLVSLTRTTVLIPNPKVPIFP